MKSLLIDISISLKEGTRRTPGNEGTTFEDINNHDEIPSDFQKDFIRNGLNKDTLYQYLAERIIDINSFTSQTLVVTDKDVILKTHNVLDEDINSYKYEEADACVIRQLISISKCQMFGTIVVYASDTDVLLLCLTYHHHCEFEGSAGTVFCKIGQGPSLKIYNVIVNARIIGLNTSQTLPISRAFIGCIYRVKLFQP